jgi:hypothetical protein
MPTTIQISDETKEKLRAYAKSTFGTEKIPYDVVIQNIWRKDAYLDCHFRCTIGETNARVSVMIEQEAPLHEGHGHSHYLLMCPKLDHDELRICTVLKRQCVFACPVGFQFQDSQRQSGNSRGTG